jgi:hypothetical protein
MDTMNGPADFLEVPSPDHRHRLRERRSPRRWSTSAEFTADLIKHNKLKLDPEPQRPPEA